jgi:GTP-binding protein EngB required for normal cell division
MTTAETAATQDPSLTTIIDRLQAIQSKYKLYAIQRHIDACRAILELGELLDIGIFGRFKAGKSSFLNFLSGRPVLPVGVTPLTTSVTRLHYGIRDRATVRYLDGRSEVVPIESVKIFVSESENPGNVKKVDAVTVELPSLKIYQGLQFVDTPGLESALRHNTETTLGWLPKVGLALVTISVDPPLSRQDVKLIRMLRGYTPKIIVLLTKTDLVSEGERAEVAAFIGGELKKEFGCEFRILPFSVHAGHQELRQALDQDLLFPLLKDRATACAEITRYKFKALLEQARDYLSLALAAAERADLDRSDLKSRILNEKTSFESIRMELQALMTESAGQTRPWIMKRTGEISPDIEKRITLEIQTNLSASKANLWKLSRAYEEWLEESIRREMTEVSLQEGELFGVPLEKARAALTRAVQGFRDRLAGNIEQALGMRFQVEPFAIDLQKPSSPHVSISNPFMFNTDLLWFVIPMSIFRGWAKRHFLDRIPYEIEKNLSRLASQWTESINAAILKMQRDAERHVRDQISTVESMLSRTQSESEEIRVSLLEVESFRCTITS